MPRDAQSQETSLYRGVGLLMPLGVQSEGQPQPLTMNRIFQLVSDPGIITRTPWDEEAWRNLPRGLASNGRD